MLKKSKRPKNNQIKKALIFLLIISQVCFYLFRSYQPQLILKGSNIIIDDDGITLENNDNITTKNNNSNIILVNNSHNTLNKNENIPNDIQSKELRCLSNGWPENGTKLLWRYYYYPEYPSLEDIFEDNGEIVVILNTFLIKTHRTHKQRMIKYHKSQWALYLHKDNTTSNQNTVINPKNPIITSPDNDKKRFIIKLRFSLPKEYQNKYNFATIQILLGNENLSKIGEESYYRPLKGKEPLYSPEFYEKEKEIQGGAEWTKLFMKPYKSSNNNDLSYRNVPFCAIKDKFSFYVNPPPEKPPKLSDEQKIYTSPNGQQKDFLRLCTQNLIFDEKEKNEDLVRWLLYHTEQGFQKPIIYISKIVKSENISLSHFKKIIDLGLAEFVYFVFPYAFFFHEQVAQEISCNERNRGRTVWLAHNDVDEIFYHHINGQKDTASTATIAELMKKYTKFENFKYSSGLKCPNLWMKRLKDDTTYADSIQKYNQRTKSITIPENVNFYYIHTVSTGKKMIRSKDISNGHFKNVSSINTTFVQEILYPRITEINKRLTKEIKELLV